MREPLNSFAARISNNGELTEFLQGLVEEHHVSPKTLMRAAKAAVTPSLGRNGQCTECFEHQHTMEDRYPWMANR